MPDPPPPRRHPQFQSENYRKEKKSIEAMEIKNIGLDPWRSAIVYPMVGTNETRKLRILV
jgi:hypothetical protein